MWIAADVSGAPSMSPAMPKMAPNTDRRDEDEERVHPQRGAERDRLHDVLQQAVREQDDDQHDQRGLCALRPQREHNCEGARHERADEGDVGSDEGDDGDCPGERNVENQRPDDPPRRH